METNKLHRQARQAAGFEGDNPQLLNAPSAEISLRDHLLKQTNVDLSDPIDRIIAVYMVDSLDDSGYLVVPIEDISATLGCPLERVKIILGAVQDFDPPGVSAQNLSECLDRSSRISTAMTLLCRFL